MWCEMPIYNEQRDNPSPAGGPPQWLECYLCGPQAAAGTPANLALSKDWRRKVEGGGRIISQVHVIIHKELRKIYSRTSLVARDVNREAGEHETAPAVQEQWSSLFSLTFRKFYPMLYNRVKYLPRTDQKTFVLSIQMIKTRGCLDADFLKVTLLEGYTT